MLQHKKMLVQFSAGGVVYKKDGKNLDILLGQHSGHHGWVFPKGLIGDKVEDEGIEETALREVEEETGIIGKITQKLDPVEFWFVMDGEKIKKTVYYFLMEYVSGDTTNHDWEMENVEWLKATEVEQRLTYPSDKKVWQQAQKLLA
jgi:8-oxo-dGTP pyrophosphatase MutT (NUDIX family)